MPRFRGFVHACTLAAALGAPIAFANSIVVRPGDTLSALARAHGTTAAELMAANDMDSDFLVPGQELRLPEAAAPAVASAPTTAPAPAVAPAPAAAPATPAPATPAPAPAAATDTATAAHVVAPGESLWALARRYDTTVAALMSANALTSDALRPGTTLRVPAPGDAAPTAAAPAAATEVTVRLGDSLYEIALAHGVSVDDLIAWNDLDGTLIKPGQVLALQQPASTPAAPLVVHVESGDSLWTLARRHDTTVEALAAANGIGASSTLRIGQALTVPGRYAAVHATSGAAGADVGGAAAAEVRVVPGDNLWKIARQHNTTVASLMALNGLPHDRLVVGQTLRVVPGPELGAAAVETTPLPSVADGMVWPLVGQITSRYGYRRLRISNTNMHYGLDIDGDIGDPLRAATSGTVTFSGWRGGYGNLVIITQGDTEYYYAHASALLVQEGQTVSAGQLIARVGATGNVTGPHLHFEIRVDGTPVDPLPILESRASR